ncbi:YihY/virulence factor BrkB family protein [Zafaria sp. Z1313]|uniref:YihY/virulence factor BrkB family protein n=1 Tax=unclassified Zafaria TaxID=2828765 RepID=UPI002E7690A3|nr:YihY/virulence factor BrkB family protein [Zafaria sp. J156]MEE1619889.1 YihY/virulence factor BrkB family protein [Zafaria sp. J156]
MAVRETTGTGDAAETDEIHPLDRAGLRAEALRKRAEWGKAKREKRGAVAELAAAAQWLLARLNAFRPLRVWTLYGRRHGPLMAAGSAYNMFFSVAAMLVAGFSIFGLVASGNRELQDAVVETVAETTPGLIDTGDGGLATPDVLFNSGGFGWALVISTAAMLLTSLGWIAGLREGMRGVYGLPPVKMNPVLAKLRDLGILALLGVSLVVTSGVGLVVGAALQTVLDILNLESGFAAVMTRLAGIAVMLLLDAAVAVVLFRLASSITMPRAVMLQAALIAAIGSTLLRSFSSLLLGSVGNNPLLAPFAVILGLFVWFFLLSQVYLVATAWGAVGSADAETDADAGSAAGPLSLRRRAAILRADAHTRSPAPWPPAKGR